MRQKTPLETPFPEEKKPRNTLNQTQTMYEWVSLNQKDSEVGFLANKIIIRSIPQIKPTFKGKTGCPNGPHSEEFVKLETDKIMIDKKRNSASVKRRRMACA